MFLGITLLLLLAVFLFPLSPLMPFRMLPKADRDQFFVSLDLPTGTAFQKTNRISEELARIILSENDVTSVESFIGTAPIIDFNGLFKGNSERTLPSQGTLKVNLVSEQVREDSSEEIASRVREISTRFQKEFPDAVIGILEDPPGPPVSATFFLDIQSEEKELRETVTSELASRARDIPGIVDLSTSLPDHPQEDTYRIRFDKAALLGISPKEISTTLETAFSGRFLDRLPQEPLSESREARRIHLRFAKEYRATEDDIALIKVRNSRGDLVSLSALVEKVSQREPSILSRKNRVSNDSVSAELERRSVIYAVLDLFPSLLSAPPSENLRLVSWSPLRVVYENIETGKPLTLYIGGEWKLTLEVFRDLGIAFGVALAFIFFLLALRTQSFFTPLLIMASIPLGLLGIFPGFAVLFLMKGTYFNATSMIGVIALSGLAVKKRRYLPRIFRATQTFRDTSPRGTCSNWENPLPSYSSYLAYRYLRLAYHY
ncbi:MAG: efflux RND transporter permease subunit [Candidatus Moraniibacteriota bacterium]|nr:MAG: efflux RND transporter permease subunit [Candidatus Moranbacteria bacterium]